MKTSYTEDELTIILNKDEARTLLNNTSALVGDGIGEQLLNAARTFLYGRQKIAGGSTNTPRQRQNYEYMIEYTPSQRPSRVGTIEEDTP